MAIIPNSQLKGGVGQAYLVWLFVLSELRHASGIPYTEVNLLWPMKTFSEKSVLQIAHPRQLTKGAAMQHVTFLEKPDKELNVT